MIQLIGIPSMMAALVLVGFGIGWLSKPQYKRDSRGRFTK